MNDKLVFCKGCKYLIDSVLFPTYLCRNENYYKVSINFYEKSKAVPSIFSIVNKNNDCKYFEKNTIENEVVETGSILMGYRL